MTQGEQNLGLPSFAVINKNPASEEKDLFSKCTLPGLLRPDMANAKLVLAQLCSMTFVYKID